MITIVLFVGVILILFAVKVSKLKLPEELVEVQSEVKEINKPFFPWDFDDEDDTESHMPEQTSVAKPTAVVVPNNIVTKVEYDSFDGDLTQGENENENENFDFDLKKAIVYSEIIKPKYF